MASLIEVCKAADRGASVNHCGEKAAWECDTFLWFPSRSPVEVTVHTLTGWTIEEPEPEFFDCVLKPHQGRMQVCLPSGIHVAPDFLETRKDFAGWVWDEYSFLRCFWWQVDAEGKRTFAKAGRIRKGA